MPPGRPRSSSLSALDIDESDWMQPSAWNARRAASASSDPASERRSARAQFAALALPAGRPSRTLAALDLAQPRGAARHGMPAFGAAAAAMQAAGKHSLDVNALVGALGGDAKLKANIETRMQAHRDQHAAFAEQFKLGGLSALHAAPAMAMKAANQKLSALQAHRMKSKK